VLSLGVTVLLITVSWFIIGGGEYGLSINCSGEKTVIPFIPPKNILSSEVLHDE
jgi:hypothetical protein